MRTLCFLGLVILLAGCDGQSNPKAQFDPIAVKRPLNMTRKLSDEFTLVSPDDTLELRLAFDAATGRNTFITSTADTVLTARVFRFRGLYYFVETGSDGANWVHAARIGRGQVQGLNTGYRQMIALSGQVQQGNFSELVRFRNASNDSLRLRFDRRQLRNFYAAQLDSLPVYRLQTRESRSIPAEALAPSVAPVVGPYPNPARQQASLDFAIAADRLVTLCDEHGRLLRTFSAVGRRLTFSVADLPTGNYIVRIREGNGGAAPLALRLLVEQ
ncbi:T9SS type A sorting domain-containing protein [Hymenobacter aerophilus]|uniref:T9SS type A sorting domain-containing protein n=1 Tax=Hymenobacter aerophilus TaxID=119644 RepID=UPI00037617E7|nr:T9SS type A sorting domain-containing protein [Hymenobacter aerophilus]